MRTIKKLSMIFMAALIFMMLPLSSYAYEEKMQEKERFDNLAALQREATLHILHQSL